jgi:hypothetical protein
LTKELKLKVSSAYFNIIFEDFVFSFEGLAIFIYKMWGDLQSWEVFCMEVVDKLVPLEKKTEFSMKYAHSVFDVTLII